MTVMEHAGRSGMLSNGGAEVSSPPRPKCRSVMSIAFPPVPVHAHDPLVCGIDYLSSCPDCRAAEDRAQQELDERMAECVTRRRAGK